MAMTTKNIQQIEQQPHNTQLPLVRNEHFRLAFTVVVVFYSLVC